MTILSINRDNYVGGPSIVRLTTSDTLSSATTSGYLTAQATIIALLNNGAFEWSVGDMVALFASDGNGTFQFSGNDFSSLIPLDPGDLPSNVVLNNQLNAMANAASALYLFAPAGVAVESGGSVTINAQAGFIQTSSLTTASGSSHILTMNNNVVRASSVMNFTFTTLGSSTAGDAIFFKYFSAAGSCSLSILNGNSGALNGTLTFSFNVVS